VSSNRTQGMDVSVRLPSQSSVLSVAIIDPIWGSHVITPLLASHADETPA